MAEPISIQQLKNASEDAISLGEAVNGDENSVVITRLGETYPTLSNAINQIDSKLDSADTQIKQGIANLFENGGLPATPFATKALMTASTLVDGDYAMVTDNTVNNGLYVKTAGSWVKSAYDPLENAKLYADANPLFKPVELTASDSLDSITTNGLYRKSTSGDISVDKGYPVPQAGMLNVISAAAASAVQIYTVFSTGERYTRYITAGNFTDWKLLELTQHLEWTRSATNEVSYNPTDRRVTITGTVLSSFANARVSTYLRISNITVDMTNDYDVCYLDLASMIKDGVFIVDATNQASYVKIAVYSSTVLRVGYIPLFKYDGALNTVVPCAGFVPINDGMNMDYPDHLEWGATSTGSVNYVSATRTVNINQHIIASYRGVRTNRIRIASVSVVLPNDFDVCFIDLRALGTTDNIDSTNAASVLKVGSYDRKTGDYFNKPWELPLFKYSRMQGKVVPCAGFVAIASDTDSIPSSGGGSGMEFSKSATLCDIYIKQPSGNKLKVGLLHQIIAADPLASTQSNSNLWRLYKLTRCGADNSIKNTLTTDGEFELAITHREATQTEGVTKDHVGGVHGDELLTDAKIFVDGCMINTAATVSLKPVDKVELIQHSVIYFQNTTRPMCDHYKHITITDGVINVKQTIDFKYEALSLNSAWIAMLPILRTDGSYQITDKSANSLDNFLSVQDNTTENFERLTFPISDGVVVKQWSTGSNISAETTLIKTPNSVSTQSMNITNSPLYNKLYVSATNAATTTAVDIAKDTVWNVEAEYDVKC